MTDVFAKAMSELKVSDFNGELPAPPKIKEPSSLDLLREAGVAGGTRPRNSIDIVGDMVKLEREKRAAERAARVVAKKTAAAAPLNIPSWQEAVAKIQGYDTLPYEQKKSLYDDYVQRATAAVTGADPTANAASIEQQVRDAAPAPVDPTGGRGDFARGWASYLRNTKAVAAGSLGYVLNKFGAEDTGKELMQAALDYTKEASDVSKNNDSFTEALKPNGSLVDWAQFNTGQLLGSVLESVATTVVGGTIGAAAGGVGAAPGAAAGFFGKSLVKKEVFELIKKEMITDAKTQIASGVARSAALTAAKQRAKEKLGEAAIKASRTLGGEAGLLAASGARGVGEIVQQAQQAGLDPNAISGFDVATGAGVYALLETFSDKLLLDTITGGASGKALKRTLLKGGATALTEGLTEVGQDAATGLASGTGLQSGKQALDAFAAGAAGGGIIGGGAALLRGNADENAPPAPEVTGTEEDLTNVEPDAAPLPAAGTTFDVEGATLVWQPDGTVDYAPGQTPNSTADTVIIMSTPTQPQQSNTAPTAAQTEALVAQLQEARDRLEQEGTPEAEDAAQQLIESVPTQALQAADALDPQGAASFLARRFGQQDRLFDPRANEPAATPPPVRTEVAAPATTVQELNDQLEPHVSAAQNDSQQTFEALQDANRLLLQAPREVVDAALQDPNSAVSFFRNTLGMQVTQESVPNAPWVQAIQTITDGEQVLNALSEGDDFQSGQLNSSLADFLIAGYSAAGIPLPTVQWNSSTTGRELGSYLTSQHLITFNPRTTANTVAHEFMHGLTVKGLQRINTLAAGGDRQAADVLSLIRALHVQLIAAADGLTAYGNQNVAEMLAEMMRPEFIALAAHTRLGKLSPEARRGLDAINASPSTSVLRVIANLVSYILSKISGSEQQIPAESILATLVKVAAETANRGGTAARMNTPAPANTSMTPSQQTNLLAALDALPSSAPVAEVIAVVQAGVEDPRILIPLDNERENYRSGLINRTDFREQVRAIVEGGGNNVIEPATTSSSPVPAAIGTQVTNVERDNSRLPPESSMDFMRNGAPNTIARQPTTYRWMLQPGTIVSTADAGQFLVLSYAEGGTSAVVQPLDNTGRVSGTPYERNFSFRFSDVVPTLPAGVSRGQAAQQSSSWQAPISTPEQRTQPTPQGAKAGIAGLRRLGSRIASLFSDGDSAGDSAVAFRGVKALGALETSVPNDAGRGVKIQHFIQAMQDGIAQLNAAAQAAGTAVTWRVETLRDLGEQGVLVFLTEGSNAERYMAKARLQDTGTIYVDSTGFSNTTTRGTEDAFGGRFYDVLYGANVVSGLKPYLGTITDANAKRMPVNRLRAMLKWGSIHGFTRARSILGVGQSGAYRFNGYEAIEGHPDAALLKLLQRRVLNSFGSNPVFNTNGTYTFGERTFTRRELRDFVRQRAQESPDVVAAVALANAMAAPGASTTRLAQAFIDTQLDQGPMLFSYGEAATEAEAEAQAEQQVDDTTPRPERRTSTSALASAMRTGTPASPATPGRGVMQAIKARDKSGILRATHQLTERINEELHDASVRMKRWLQTLPEGEGGVTAQLKQRVIGAMYTARKLRDDILRRGNDRFLRTIDRGVAEFARRQKISLETAQRDIGYAITAAYVPEANAKLLATRIKELQALQAQVMAAQAAQQTENIDQGLVPEAQQAADNAPVEAVPLDVLQQQLGKAQRDLIALISAINSPNLQVRKHGGGGVAGMNNAQAADMIAGLKERYGEAGFAEIQKVAEKVYDLNAWKLTVDIESGKVTPALASQFLRKPGAVEAMKQLRELAGTVNAEDKASVDALNAKREEVMTLVRSKYVPLSGDPTKDIDDDSFHGGSGIPNVQQDYRLKGRERGSPPDDGLSTSRAAVMKSASYAGWRDFQDGIAEVHRQLSPENRQAFGLRAETLTPGRSTLSNKAVVRNRGGKATAFVFTDENLVDSIRGASRLENNFLLENMGKVTRFYSYMATQFNPFFAPFNFLRDAWERNEILRTRTYLDASGTKINSGAVANGMIKYLTHPELLRATYRHAFGKPVDTSSRMGRYLDEFLAQGGVSGFSSQFHADRAKMIAQISKQQSWRKQLHMLSSFVEGYNKTLDIGPALAAFVSMRDQGMTAKDAAAGSLDLMDFGKRGKSANVLGSVYAFAQPTFTGAANALGALRDPVNGKWNKVGVTRFAGYAIGLYMLQGFLRSLADDDEGGNKLDQQSPFMKNNFLLIPYGNDGMIKVPLAYGLTRVANGIARAALGVSTDEQTPTEALGKAISGSVVPVFSPIEDSDIDWFERPMQAFLTTLAPSWMKPPLALATNTTPFDTKVVNDKYGDATKFRSEQYGKYIPEDYKSIAIFMRKTLGIDMAPEEVRYLVRAYPTGVAQLVLNGIVEEPDGGISGAALKKTYAGYSEYARYFQFKKAIDETDELLKQQNAGEDVADRDKLRWRLAWDEQDKGLRAAKAKISRSKVLSEAGKAAAKDAADAERTKAQILALYNYRRMQGKPAEISAP